MSKVIIDAKNQVVGRLASIVATEVLKGKEIDIVNAEHAVIIGNPDFIVKNYDFVKCFQKHKVLIDRLWTKKLS